jgi:hypothetical protein
MRSYRRWVVLASSGEYLLEMPSRRQPSGVWTANLEEALRFPVEHYGDEDTWRLTAETFMAGPTDLGRTAAWFIKRFPPAYWPKVVPLRGARCEEQGFDLKQVKGW